MDPSQPSVSVLIPTRGRPADLQRCIESVLASEHSAFEVIVVEQGDHKTALPADARLVHVMSQTVGKSAALNEGVALARANFFAFTDDDCTVPPDWLAKGLCRMREYPGAGLVFGALLAIEHDPSIVFIPEFRPKEVQVVRGTGQAFKRGGAGANLFARREAIQAVPGFDPLIGPGARYQSCEEFDLFYRVLRAGFEVVRDPGNPVSHWGARPYADGSGQRLLRGYYYGEGVVLGKHIRCLDVRALVLAAHIGLEQGQMTLKEMVQNRRLTGVGRGGYWLRGLGVGLSTRVDRKSRLFRPRGAASTPGKEGRR